MPAIVFYGMASVINSFAWFLFIRSITKPKRLNDASSAEEYEILTKGDHFALLIYTSTTVLAIWLPYVGLLINVALWILWTYISLIEKE
jgi:hypothetical protein